MIKPLIAGAARATDAMIAKAATEPHKAQKRPEEPMKRKTIAAADELETLREEAADCRACPLWKDATQTVFGEGPPHARIMLVGEQPGDKEDLAGKPFVGPAGQMLDRALDRGRHRPQARSTSPTRSSISNSCRAAKSACTRNRRRRKSRLAGHGTSANWRPSNRRWSWRWAPPPRKACSARSTPINKNRGHLIDLDDGTKALVTVHPSYLLRLPDADAKAREYERFVDDLKMAAAVLQKSATRPDRFAA